MSRNFFTIMLLSIFTLSLAALAKDYNQQRMQKVTPADDALFQERLNNIKNYVSPPSVENANRVELGRTWYDYATNNIMGRMIAHASTSGGLHTAFMKIATQGATRYVTYDYYDSGLGLFFGNASITESRQTGWGRVINGQNDEALISLHNNPSELYQDAGAAGYAFSSILQVNPGVFAGFAVQGDTIVFLSQINNVAGQAWMPGNNVFKYSLDYGLTWNDGANILPPVGAVEFSEAERWPEFNPTNPQELGMTIAISEDASASAGGWLAYITSTDFGATWQSNDFWYDDVSVTSSVFGNRTQYVIENFNQMNNMYSSDGNFHIVYGAVQGVRDSLTSTAIDYWPILHWDANSGTFHELTSLEYSAPDDPGVQAAMSANRPGNGLGNAYPHIAEGPDGELVCIWQQWEKDPGSGGVVLLNATTGGGTGTFQVFATDIWGAWSKDGGQTWSDPVYLAGNPSESDVYPNITRNVIRNGDSLYLDILYMHDTNPNVSFTNFTNFTDASEVIWYYERVALYAPLTGIEDGIATVVDKFSLSQNYPNPFNPTTTIEYSLQKTADVTLDVFNVTGQKVATLVQGRKAAGQYNVSFDAANFASGIYFYTLKAADVTITKKMVLMK